MTPAESKPGLLSRIGFGKDPEIALTLQEEYRRLMEVNRLFLQIEQAIAKSDKIERNVRLQDLKTMMSELAKELTAKVPDATAQLSAPLLKYTEEVETHSRSEPALKEEILFKVQELIRHGETFEPLNIYDVLNQMKSREQIIEALDLQNESLRKRNKRKGYAIFAVGMMFLLSTSAAITFREGQNHAVSEAKKKDEDLKKSQDEKRSLETQLQEANRQKGAAEGLLTAARQDVTRLEGDLGQARQTIQAKDQEISRLQTVPGLTDADLRRSQELRQKARSGKPLSDDEISFIRKVSDHLISEWRKKAAEEIQAIRTELERNVTSGGRSTLLSPRADSQIIAIQQRVDARVIRESQEVNSIITRAQQARH